MQLLKGFGWKIKLIYRIGWQNRQVHPGLHPVLGVRVEGSGVKWNRVQKNDNKGQGEKSQSPQIFCAFFAPLRIIWTPRTSKPKL